MKIFTVEQLNQEIKKNLELQFPTVFVEGEVSNLKQQSSGHIYFTLKDSESQISAVLFKGQSRFISHSLKEGDKVTIEGQIAVYLQRGTYQIIVKSLKAQGLGNLLAQLQRLKEKLRSEGLFDSARKKTLPFLPRVIGVITSPTGAVIQDIIHVLSRRTRGFHLLLNPVKVQGEGAKEEIAQAIKEMNKHKLCDVIIIGRGGGSLEDLWAFNEEIVVRAVADSTIPIISAVGHETDVSLCDFAADKRAATPSAAAEICSQNQQELLQKLSALQSHISGIAKQKMTSAKKQVLTLIKNPFISSSYHLLHPKMQGLDEVKAKIETSLMHHLQKQLLTVEAKKKELIASSPRARLARLKAELDLKKQALTTSIGIFLERKHQALNAKKTFDSLSQQLKEAITRKKEGLNKLTEHLQSINPKNLLTKGYCILFSEKKDSVILSVNNVLVQEKLNILLSDGSLSVEVKEKQ